LQFFYGVISVMFCPQCFLHYMFLAFAYMRSD